MSDTQGHSPPPIVPNRSYQPSFSAGELSPALWWRSDEARWRVGAAIVQNMVVTAQGGAARRGGTQFVCTVADTTAGQRVIPFQFSTSQQYVIEMGDHYMRFILQGAYVGGASTPYGIATPYALADLFGIQFTQSADVMTLVHPNYPPMQLKRLGIMNWTIGPMAIGTQLPAPTGVAVAGTTVQTPGSPAPAMLNFAYAVTASKNQSNDESTLSGSAACTNYNLGYYNQYGTVNTVTWSAVAGADFYTVYRQYQGEWGRVGSTVSTSFQDTNYVPDTANGPPQPTNPFASDNPGTVGYFQERIVFGGSTNSPETIWCSKTGNYTNFNVSNPVRADDAITYTLAARQVNQIRHLIALSDLMIFTGGGGWRLNGQNGAVTPSNFDVAPQSFVGSSAVAPLVIGNRILFIEAKGQSIREIAYQFVQNMYVSQDRSVWSRHMFAGHTIVAWAYAEAPEKVVWAVRDDGVLLSLTYLIEEEIYAWTEHNTAHGLFKSVCVVTETVNGVTEGRALLRGVAADRRRIVADDVHRADAYPPAGAAGQRCVSGVAPRLRFAVFRPAGDGYQRSRLHAGAGGRLLGRWPARHRDGQRRHDHAAGGGVSRDGRDRDGLDPDAAAARRAAAGNRSDDGAPEAFFPGAGGAAERRRGDGSGRRERDDAARGPGRRPVQPSGPAGHVHGRHGDVSGRGVDPQRSAVATDGLAASGHSAGRRHGVGGRPVRARMVVAEEAHVPHLAERMRQADRDEVWAWRMVTPTEALRGSLASSTLAWTGLLDEEPICMFGAGGGSLTGGVARPWLLGTDRIEEIPATFARMSRVALAQIVAVWPALSNWSDARHERAHAWLEWLGFTMGAPQPMGPFGMPFRPFWMGARDV